MEPEEYARAVETCSKTPQECPTCERVFVDPDKIIEDEYGDLYTAAEFAQVLEECPIRSTRSVGKYFG
jgi:hypothetical protein